MKDRRDKRRHQRLRLCYDISCRRVGTTADKPYAGRAVNASSGGLYIETVGGELFEPGALLKVTLKVPPTAGLLEFGGKIAGYASVVRAERIPNDNSRTDPAVGKYGVAVQFCRPPKLCL